MSTQFYPASNSISEDLYLEVNSFNANHIFDMLGLQGTGEQGTVGSIDIDRIPLAINYMNEFIREEQWRDFGWDTQRMLFYVAKLNFILGFCIGNKCQFRWS